MACNDLEGGNAAKVCEVGGGGLLLPVFGDAEQEWPNGLRIFLYLTGLLWCFMGVAIIADIFMGSIEKITSKKVLVFDKSLNKLRTKTVWNATVANLTLMALGSSAPEILLNVVGIFPSFTAGELGPSTIVGSAAFNLLCITAVCIVAIPAGEVRWIRDVGVFGCTAFFSIFAYVWLLIILALPPSKDVITVYEGVITFALFWVLIVVAFLFDTGKIPGFTKPPSGLVVQRESTPEELFEMEQKVREKYGKGMNLDDTQVALLIEHEFRSPASRATYRVQATRDLLGGRKIVGRTKSSPREMASKLAVDLLAKLGIETPKMSRENTLIKLPLVGFKTQSCTVLESIGTVMVNVQAVGNLTEQIKVKFCTKDGTATRDSDYEFSEGVLEFGPGQTEATVPIKIVESKGTHESTEEFYVELAEHPDFAGKYLLGDIPTATIVILDEDQPGRLRFDKEMMEVTPAEKSEKITVVVRRKGGSHGKVSCTVRTEDGSAISEADFEPIDTVLEFEHGQIMAQFQVTILPKARFERKEIFRVVLGDPTGGVTFDSTTDGGQEKNILSIIISSSEESKTKADKLRQLVAVNWDSVSLGNATYKEQFIAAVYVNGSAEEQKEAKIFDWIMHIVSFPWKLLFATVPPAEYAGGWICFFVALMFIGIVTVIIGDLAELLGCTLNISAATTAITLVALGTSLPDTFASRAAAVADPFADNSIGNITGSNSVNVFLGLGLPWMIQAIYWEVAQCVPGDKWSLRYPEVAAEYPGGVFAVPAGSLTISVATFVSFALITIALLLVRRKVFGGELGGDKVPAYISAGFLVLLWAVYIVISIIFEDE